MQNVMKDMVLDLPEGLNPNLAKVLQEQAKNDPQTALTMSAASANVRPSPDTIINITKMMLEEVMLSFRFRLDHATMRNSKEASDAHEYVSSFISSNDIIALYVKELEELRKKLRDLKSEELESSSDYERLIFISKVAYRLHLDVSHDEEQSIGKESGGRGKQKKK